MLKTFELRAKAKNLTLICNGHDGAMRLATWKHPSGLLLHTVSTKHRLNVVMLDEKTAIKALREPGQVHEDFKVGFMEVHRHGKFLGYAATITLRDTWATIATGDEDLPIPNGYYSGYLTPLLNEETIHKFIDGVKSGNVEDHGRIELKPEPFANWLKVNTAFMSYGFSFVQAFHDIDQGQRVNEIMEDVHHWFEANWCQS